MQSQQALYMAGVGSQVAVVGIVVGKFSLKLDYRVVKFLKLTMIGPKIQYKNCKPH